MSVEESVHIRFNESHNDLPKERDEDAGTLEILVNPANQKNIFSKPNIQIQQTELENSPGIEQETTQELEADFPQQEEVIHDIQMPKTARYLKNHPPENIIGDINKGITTRRGLQNQCAFSAFLSQVEPKTAKEAILDESWLMAM